MKWNAFIDRLKSELPGYASDVDADAIWKGIEPAVDKINSRKKRRPFWLPLLLLTGLLTVGGAAYLVFNGNSGEHQQVFVADDQGEAAEDVDENAPSGNSELQAPVKEKGRETHPGNTADADGSSADAAAPDVRQPGKRTTKNADKRAREDKGTSPADYDYTAAAGRKERKAAQNSRPGTNGSAESPASKTAAAGTSSASFTTFRPVHDVYLEENVSRGEGDPGTTNSWGKQGAHGRPVLTASVHTTSAMLMQAYSRVETASSLAAMNNYQREARPSTDCPEFGKAAGLSFLIGVHGGVAYPFRKLSSTAEGESLKALREDTEKCLVTGNMGVDFKMRHKSGIEIGTGLQYNTLLERLDITRTIETTEMEYGIQAISINPMGDTVYIMGDIPVTTTTTERKRFYNRYRFIEIPVLFGYSAVVNNLRLGGEAGIIAGILTKTDGMILDADEMFTDLNSDNAAVSGSRFAMSYYFGASVSYLYESGIELGFHPHLRFMPSDFGAADYPVRSKYFMVGGNVSIRYRFGN